ncbi:hypothetical protein [Endothiovibrio diazotrophicus]
MHADALERMVATLGHHPDIAALLPATTGDTPAQWIERYRRAVALMERELWRDHFDDGRLALYQQLFREQEAWIAATGDDRRHRFVVVIPVADRPEHLESCLESLLTLCRLYRYGGLHAGRYRKVAAVVVDDSLQEASLAAHRALAEHYRREGLDTLYLSQAEQRSLVVRHTDAGLTGIIGDGERLQHKGASITRNLTYLKLAELAAEGPDTLFHFIDSDQQFRVNVETPDGERRPYAINYFHHLDRIFRERGAQLLTGKVVGDPPVAPAVMAGNFLDDVTGFLAELAPRDPAAPCSLHDGGGPAVSDAAYHDMADLFGYRPTVTAYRYRCPLDGDHDHAATFADFAARLDRFFDGEHPTRRSHYQPAPLEETVQPARTVYTGNYLFTPEALEWFIPFAPLKLRMAGPVLGRIVQAELGERFLSANLPMLHTRTVERIGHSEYRPGVDRSGARVDLSGEFERQYFGDVMLFTMERLTAAGFPGEPPAEAVIFETVEEVEAELHEKYLNKHSATAGKLERLRILFDDPDRWWHGTAVDDEARAAFARFIANIDHNFGTDSRAYRLIRSTERRTERKAEITAAIVRYPAERAAWRAALRSAPR